MVVLKKPVQMVTLNWFTLKYLLCRPEYCNIIKHDRMEIITNLTIVWKYENILLQTF
jgi:hypothetical protein